MIRIRFPDDSAKWCALGRLAGRFAFTSRATGEMLVPEAALDFLTQEGILFRAEGRDLRRLLDETARLPVRNPDDGFTSADVDSAI